MRALRYRVASSPRVTITQVDDARRSLDGLQQLLLLPATLSGVLLGRVYSDDNRTESGCVSGAPFLVTL